MIEVGGLFAGVVGLVALFVAFFFVIIYIWAIVSILVSRKSVVEKLLWVVLIIAAPLIGLLVWYFLGRHTGPLITTVDAARPSSGKIKLADLNAEQLRDVEQQLAALKRKDLTAEGLRNSLDWKRP